MLPVSIVITTHDQCDLLRRHLPVFLEQDYGGDVEVVVVDMNSTDDTKTYLEQMVGRTPNLRVIPTPESARNISPTRLALTLGFRAATHDWVIVTQADCCPSSSRWLSCMIESGKDVKTQMVLGYTRFVDVKGWNGLRCRFFRAWQQLLHLEWARNHRAYRCDGTNLCYRRSYFLEHKGFADETNLLMGATDIMVNRNSTQRNTSVCLKPDAVMLQTAPTSPCWWSEERMFFMETSHHFAHTFAYRLRYMLAVWQIWLPTLLALLGIAFGIVSDMWPIIVASALAWPLVVGVSSYRFSRRLRAIGEAPIRLALPLLMHLIPLWDFTAWLNWLFTKRQTFLKKYI